MHKQFDQILTELRSFGFRVNEKFLLDTFGESSTCSFEDAYDQMIHSDFRKSAYLEPCFGATISTSESGTLEGPVVLQVGSVTNITQPSKRQHEESTPRLLLIKLTDGHSTATAIEYESIPDMNTKVAPGTKLLLRQTVKICCGKILLTGKSCQVLGGRVDHLYSSWLTNRTTLSNRKEKKQESSGEEAPPQFELTISPAATITETVLVKSFAAAAVAVVDDDTPPPSQPLRGLKGRQDIGDTSFLPPPSQHDHSATRVGSISCSGSGKGEGGREARGAADRGGGGRNKSKSAAVSSPARGGSSASSSRDIAPVASLSLSSSQSTENVIPCSASRSTVSEQVSSKAATAEIVAPKDKATDLVRAATKKPVKKYTFT